MIGFGFETTAPYASQKDRQTEKSNTESQKKMKYTEAKIALSVFATCGSCADFLAYEATGVLEALSSASNPVRNTCRSILLAQWV